MRVRARGAEPSAPRQDWGLTRPTAGLVRVGRSARWSLEGRGRALGVRARRSEAFRVNLRGRGVHAWRARSLCVLTSTQMLGYQTSDDLVTVCNSLPLSCRGENALLYLLTYQ